MTGKTPSPKNPMPAKGPAPAPASPAKGPARSTPPVAPKKGNPR